MITKIGIVSGQILAALQSEARALNSRELNLLLKEPLDEILMSIGWLIREGYIQMETLKGECFISIIPGSDVGAFRNRLLSYEGLLVQSQEKEFLALDKLPKPILEQRGRHSRFQEFVETMHCGAYMADLKGTLTYVNQAFVQMLGYSRKEEILKSNISQELHMNPEDYESLIKSLEQKSYVDDYEVKCVRKDGKVIALSETIHAMKDAHGHLIGIESLVRDITERKKEEKQLSLEKMKLEHILSLHEEISSIIKLEELVDFVIAKAIEILDVHRCSLMLVDKDRNELVIKGAKGLGEDIIQDTRIKLGDQIAGVVAMYGEPMLVNDIDVKSPINRKNRPTYKGKAFLSVPIKLEKKVIGVMNVAEKGMSHAESFTPSDLKVLSAIIRQAAVAIENANLYRELKYLSITDPLTGLYNHRHFSKSLNQEIKRVKRYPSPLCLMMIDTDHFKTYNDTYGHLEGDRLLKEISRVMVKNLREIDIACRYGGDEFAVILLETKIHKAEIVAQKFQKAVAALDIKQPVTLSIGIAAYSEHLDRHEFIMKADRALYQSKKDGRNRISVYA